MNMYRLAGHVAALYSTLYGKVASRPKYAGPLKDVSKLRFQAVFLMGPAGSGKSYVVDGTYLKYLPGAPAEGAQRDNFKKFFKQDLSEQERGLSDLSFNKSVEILRSRGFEIELATGGSSAKIPFKLYSYDHQGQEHIINPKDYSDVLPGEVYKEVQDLTDVIYKAPKHELPSYWRQVNPDLYKEELAGFRSRQPGYVHEMSSEMSKGYFQAALESGDPLIIDGTGTNLRKMTSQFAEAKEAGYRVTVLYVYVPLTISLMRNAARARKVDAFVVLGQWQAVKKNFAPLKARADRAKFVDNTNPAFDKKVYAKHREQIESFMIAKTGKGLADFVLENAPEERDVLRKLGAL